MIAALKHPLRIATRGSPLARAQARLVAGQLAQAHAALAEPAAIQTLIIKTTGDRFLDRPLAEIGGKGLFTKEIDHALLSGAADIAVHSMKDVPTALPDGIIIPCLLPREDARDALIGCKSLDDLPQGARVGTASLRRQAQLLRRRPDLDVRPLRGNVGTRLDKLAEGEFDATLLALAGLRRLGRADAADAILGLDIMLPAVAQGAIGVACRTGDETAHALLAPLHDDATAAAVAAERAFLAALEGDCRTPIAAHARIRKGRLVFQGLAAGLDGRDLWRAGRDGDPAEAGRLGAEAGAEVKAQAGSLAPNGRTPE